MHKFTYIVLSITILHPIDKHFLLKCIIFLTLTHMIFWSFYCICVIWTDKKSAFFIRMSNFSRWNNLLKVNHQQLDSITTFWLNIKSCSIQEPCRRVWESCETAHILTLKVDHFIREYDVKNYFGVITKKFFFCQWANKSIISNPLIINSVESTPCFSNFAKMVYIVGTIFNF